MCKETPYIGHTVVSNPPWYGLLSLVSMTLFAFCFCRQVAARVFNTFFQALVPNPDEAAQKLPCL